MRAVTVHVAARGNAFMTDIAEWIVEAARQTGRDAKLVADRLPAADGGVHLVVAPHEFFVLSDATDDEVARAASVSIPICTEQPGTPWFNLACGLVRDSPVVLDINLHGVAGLQARGFDARHLRLGGVPSMAATGITRDVDLLFLGGSTPRRAAELAALAPQLWNRPVDLRLFRFSTPIHGDVPGTVFGREKYELLARSRILLNVHRDAAEPGYFEWARMIEAMANGCAVLTEPATGYEPLVEGRHFAVADDLRDGLAELLDDPARCREIGDAARSAVLDEHPLATTLGPILDELDELDAADPCHSMSLDAERASRPAPRGHRPPLFAEFRPLEPLRREVYVALLDEVALIRGIERARCRIVHGRDDVFIRTETPSHRDATPDVSVIVTLYNYAHLVTETLDSIVASQDVDLEIVVVDDHSRDDGRSVVQAYMHAHPDVAIRLVGCEVNRGLPTARNLAISETRAELVMVVDADNHVYPNCLRVLADALAGDPAAAFAYATLEAFGAEPGLRSELAWFAPWLCEANYIDAQAMVRRSTFERHGGYRDFHDLAYGWEDWELWLRLAAAGEHGVHVPRMLGRYRTQPSSMLTITNLVADEMRAHLRALHPGLPWPEGVAVANAGEPDPELAAVMRARARARRRQFLLQSPVASAAESARSLGIWRRTDG